MLRRLAAIVAGDIAGYSRALCKSMKKERTAAWKRIERDLIEPSIVEHHGGASSKPPAMVFFAIFDSPVEAVRCGIVIQQKHGRT